jgi:anaerobic C4-dicarboxylate transporter
MSDTFVTGDKAYLVSPMRSLVQTWPWTLAISLVLRILRLGEKPDGDHAGDVSL